MKKILTVGFGLVCSLVSHGQVQQNPLLPATWNIKSEELLGFVVELAGDKYQGRLTGSEGYRQSAEWVAGKFGEWGLLPALPDKQWMQEFPQ
ncbi:MAG: hypothetical protein WCW62_08820, partial [Bacteroidales bacterium]